MSQPFISICIPAYKRTDFLHRVLDSIRIQTFRDFEVIITDDSPDETVKGLAEKYSSSFSLKYFKNSHTLGTPENWNEGIRKAEGQWIKIMHDDDWFSSPFSLQKFAEAAKQNSSSFIFSAYSNHYLDEHRVETVVANNWRLKQLRKNSATLFSSNVIGPPSVCMHRNDGSVFYDKETKWLVDIDFYVRRLKNEQFLFIAESLVSVGLSNEQVTQACFRNAAVEIPEHFHMLKKLSPQIFKNILVYDAWWRLFRNLNIHSENDIRKAGYKEEVPSYLLKMLKFQSRIPQGFLKNGLSSKAFMFFNFLTNKLR